MISQVQYIQLVFVFDPR